MAPEPPFLGDLAQGRGNVKSRVNRRNGSTCDLYSDPFYLVSGSFKTLN